MKQALILVVLVLLVGCTRVVVSNPPTTTPEAPAETEDDR